MARILVLSDLHLVAPPRLLVRGVDPRRGLAAALAHARAAGEYDRVVLVGDLVDRPAPGSYALLRELLADWAPGALLLAGNHDRLAPLRAELPPGPGGPEGRFGFAVDAGGWRLIGADSHWRGRIAGRLGAAQLDWLERTLSADPRPAVLFVHHPPVAVGTRWLDWSKLVDAEALAALLARTGRTRLVVHGHVHMASERTLAGVRVVGMPSTAFQFVPGSLLPRRGPAIPGYRVLELGEGRIETEVIYVQP